MKEVNVLWDFDGTLFDTYPIIIQNFLTVLGRNEDRKEVLSYFKQSSIQAFEKYQLDYSIENLNKIKELEKIVTPSQTPPFEGVRKALTLTNKNVIVTHKNRRQVEEILQYYDMMGLFEEMICGEELFKRKPNSESYFYMDAKYKIDLVVGDRMLDFKPAQELGILTCSFKNRKIEADYYIDDYKDFKQVLMLVKKRLGK